MMRKKGEQVEIGEDVDVKSISTLEYIWDVKNFTELIKSGLFSSPIFYGDSKDADKWNLQIKLLEEVGDAEKQVELALFLKGSKSLEDVPAKYQLNFLDYENKIIRTGPFSTVEFPLGKGFKVTYLYKNLVDGPRSILIDGNTVRVHCQISTQITLNLKRKCDEEEESSVKKQFKSFFSNGDFADVILKTENTSFPASKLILAAHSPVFSAMFSSGMLESIENTVKIEDCSDEAVKGLLEFMYTGETRILEKNPADLLKIGDKYQVMELKNKAECVLLERLRVTNAVDTLVLAHFYSPTTLKQKIIAFVNRKSKEIQQTEEFTKMARNIPDILLDLYPEISSAEKQNKS